MDIISYILSRKYTDMSIVGLGALKGANCTVKDIVHQDGINTVTFEWEGTDGTKKTRDMVVYDGTPIYVWESGNTYHYGDLAIYESQFYRCIVENHDTDFDNTKWNEIGSPDGNYDLVQSKSLLPARFTSADRKMYYVIDEMLFYFWDGYNWIAQTNVVQYTTMPTASAKLLGRVVHYVGATDANYTNCYFYKCVSNGATPAVYSWENCQVDNDIEVWKVQGELGAKNLISTDNLPYVSSGINYSLNNDGSIKIDGSATNYSTFIIPMSLKPNAYILSVTEILPTGVYVQFHDQTNDRGIVTLGNNDPSLSKRFTITEEMSNHDLRVRLIILSGITVDDLDVYPMLRYADDQDSTWQPYAMTNKQLTDRVNNIDATLNTKLDKISALPTPSSTYLNKVYLLTSTQTGYQKGGIYQCVSDGQPTPTYSWQLISSADMVEFTAQELSAMW